MFASVQMLVQDFKYKAGFDKPQRGQTVCLKAVNVPASSVKALPLCNSRIQMSYPGNVEIKTLKDEKDEPSSSSPIIAFIAILHLVCSRAPFLLQPRLVSSRVRPPFSFTNDILNPPFLPPLFIQ